MKILIVYPSLTHPVNAGNKQWAMSQVEELKKLGHDIYMLCVNVPGFKSDITQNKIEMKQTMDYWGEHGFIFNASWLNKIQYSLYMNYRKKFCRGYYKCDDLYPYGFSKYVKGLQEEFHFDACIVNYYWFTKVFEDVYFPKTAVNTHDVFAYKDQLLKKKNPWMCTTPNEEAKGVQRAQYAFALQDEEASYYERIAPKVKVLNVYCPYEIKRQPLCNNHNLVILAAAGDLNLDGLDWFCEEVFPSIIIRIPDVKLIIGGRICNLLSKYSSHPNIQLIGEVEKPDELYKLGDIAINPCRKGTGLKIKTFEALSFGKICMVHPHSKIGIYNRHQAPIFSSVIADEWAEFLFQLWNTSSLEDKAVDGIKYIESMNCHIDSEYEFFYK